MIVMTMTEIIHMPTCDVIGEVRGDQRTDVRCNDVNKTVGERVIKTAQTDDGLETQQTHTYAINIQTQNVRTKHYVTSVVQLRLLLLYCAVTAGNK